MEQADFFFDEIVQFLFVVEDPLWQVLFSDSPVMVIMSLHPEDNAVAAVVWNIHMKEGVIVSRKKSEIKFSEPVASFDKLGEMDVSCKGEIHTSSLLCK